ncbi:hypothetical protein OROHE_026632 [Orobanche hederae]
MAGAAPTVLEHALSSTSSSGYLKTVQEGQRKRVIEIGIHVIKCTSSSTSKIESAEHLTKLVAVSSNITTTACAVSSETPSSSLYLRKECCTGKLKVADWKDKHFISGMQWTNNIARQVSRHHQESLSMSYLTDKAYLKEFNGVKIYELERMPQKTVSAVDDITLQEDCVKIKHKFNEFNI